MCVHIDDRLSFDRIRNSPREIGGFDNGGIVAHDWESDCNAIRPNYPQYSPTEFLHFAIILVTF